MLLHHPVVLLLEYTRQQGKCLRYDEFSIQNGSRIFSSHGYLSSLASKSCLADLCKSLFNKTVVQIRFMQGTSLGIFLIWNSRDQKIKEFGTVFPKEVFSSKVRKLVFNKSGIRILHPTKFYISIRMLVALLSLTHLTGVSNRSFSILPIDDPK